MIHKLVPCRSLPGNHQTTVKAEFEIADIDQMSFSSPAMADELLSALYHISIPKKITGTDMNGIIELPLKNNNIIPVIDNIQPEMINTIPVILFRFIDLNNCIVLSLIILSCFHLNI